MTKKQSCRIFEKYAHQIAEMSTNELQKKVQNYQHEERKEMRAKRINPDDAFLFVPPEREKKNE